LIFYQKALPKVGWNAYKIINIKYANQIVGIKSDSLINVEALKPKHTAKDTNHIIQDSTQNIH